MRKYLTYMGFVAVLGCGTAAVETAADAGGDIAVDAAKADGATGLQPYVAPADPGKGGILLTASGEVLALGGYGFPPLSADDPVFVDGWQLEFTSVIVTVGDITLSENPDNAPTDQAQTGAEVARIPGPWAIDLHAGGPLAGKGGTDEQSVALAALTAKGDGSAFDPTQRYAFGYDLLPAAGGATNVNLDAAGVAAYAEMVKNGETARFTGVATWKGKDCKSTDASYDWTALPQIVRFSIAVAAPATYRNCQNPDNDPAAPFDGEEHQRGIALKGNQSTIAQVTIHADHLFWEAFAHDSPVHFDGFAALKSGLGSDVTLTTADLVGASISPFKDAAGKKLPWRWCTQDYTPPSQGSMAFDTLGVPVIPGGDPTSAIRDFADYLRYTVSTSGHLNSDGLCAVKRHYQSPN